MRGTLVVGLLLLVVPPVAWWMTSPPDTVGVDPTAEARPAPSPTSERSSPAWPWGGEDEVPTLEDAPAHEEVPDAGAVPVHLVVPAIGVDHPVVEVGLRPDGGMQVPDDVHEIGWYVPLGIRPGDPGTAVLAGHVDSRLQGRGAFFDLRALDVGDAIVVVTDTGEQPWTVTGRTRYPKAELPVERLFATSGEPRLVLITCGGDFDAAGRSYADNVVVFAEPDASMMRSAPGTVTEG
jgi:hypothetical protein